MTPHTFKGLFVNTQANTSCEQPVYKIWSA